MTDSNADDEEERTGEQERTDEQTQYGGSGEDPLVGAEREDEDDEDDGE